MSRLGRPPIVRPPDNGDVALHLAAHLIAESARRYVRDTGIPVAASWSLMDLWQACRAAVALEDSTEFANGATPL